jgi:hypothetical protein
MAVQYPVIGQWFRRPDGTLFEVVANDESARTVEIQQFDGTIDEIEIERWAGLQLVEVSAPEDVSGSLDMDPEDLSTTRENEPATGYQDPLAFLDDL